MDKILTAAVPNLLCGSLLLLQYSSHMHICGKKETGGGGGRKEQAFSGVVSGRGITTTTHCTRTWKWDDSPRLSSGLHTTVLLLGFTHVLTGKRGTTPSSVVELSGIHTALPTMPATGGMHSSRPVPLHTLLPVPVELLMREMKEEGWNDGKWKRENYN